MAFPVQVCVVCSEEFELKPDKPGYANRCPACSMTESTDSVQRPLSAEEHKAQSGLNEARRGAIRDLLYRKDR